jgi:hypothetical protein
LLGTCFSFLFGTSQSLIRFFTFLRLKYKALLSFAFLTWLHWKKILLLQILMLEYCQEIFWPFVGQNWKIFILQMLPLLTVFTFSRGLNLIYFHTYFSIALMLLTSSDKANIFKLSLISIIQSSGISKLFSRTYTTSS